MFSLITNFVGHLDEFRSCPGDQHHTESFLGQLHSVLFANSIGSTGDHCIIKLIDYSYLKWFVGDYSKL